MSTPGKVLVVLITLTMLGWVFLAALVAEHHSNWGKLIKTTQAEIAELEPQLPPLQEKIDRTLSDASLAQVRLDRVRRSFRGEFAMAQRDESELKETLSRYTLQHTLVDDEVLKAKARAEVRAQEKADFDRDIAREEVIVAELIAENTKLKEQLAGLEKAFLDTTAENKAYVERLKKAGTLGVKPRTRFGSFIP